MSASPRDGGPVIDPEDPTGPGAQLREARHRANLSLEEVATQLRLDRRTVRALEENEFQYLPAPTFIRGYIRSYARLLGLPPGPILEAYDFQGFTAPDLLADITQRPQARSTDIPVRLATYLVAAGLVAMVVLWWHSRESIPEAPSEVALNAGAAPEQRATGNPPPSAAETPAPPAPPAEELIAAEKSPDPAPEPSPENALASAGTAASTAPQTPARAEDPQPRDSAGDAPLVAPGTRTVTVRDALITAPDVSPGQRVTESDLARVPPQPGRLVIRFRDESWVEIFDADGIRREFRLATAGSRSSVSGTPPFNVLLGYAAGATVTFDGEDYDISRYIRGDTARFLIGPDGLARARPPERRPEPDGSPGEGGSGTVSDSSESAATRISEDANLPGAN